jgi:hypothetical protein
VLSRATIGGLLLALAACGTPLRGFLGDGGAPVEVASGVDAPSLELPPQPDGSALDASSCTTLESTGADIVPTSPTANPPSVLGGVITNGTYVLTAIDQYNATGTPAFRESYRLAGAGTASATYERGAAGTSPPMTVHEAGQWAVNNGHDVVTMTATCGATVSPRDYPYSFVATTGVLQLFDYFNPSNATQLRIYSYQRQP